MKEPNLFIVGAPRCGTTSLWSYLRGHPEVFMPAEKELYFFDSDLWGNEAWAPSLPQYLEHFAAAGHRKKVGEATPSYLRSERAPEAIKRFSPQAQIIIMLRNPVDVMYSLHSQGLRYGTEPMIDFEAGLEADRGRTGRDQQGYREFTNFPRQVSRYFTLFGRENVHTIIYDDLQKDSAVVGADVLRFLGVDPSFGRPFPRANSNRQVRSARLDALLREPPRSLRRFGRALTPHWLRSRISHRLQNSNLPVKARPPMNPWLRERLEEEFAPNIEKLSRLLGRDLSGWCRALDSGR